MGAAYVSENEVLAGKEFIQKNGEMVLNQKNNQTRKEVRRN